MSRKIFAIISKNLIKCLNLYLKIYLHMWCVFEENHRRYELLFTIVSSSFLLFNVLLLAVNIFMMNILHYRMQAMIQLITLTIVWIHGYVIRQHRTSVRKFFALLNEFEVFESDIAIQVNTSIIKYLLFLVTLLFSLIVSAILTPFLMVPFKGLEYRPMFPSVFYYSCENSISIFCIRSDTYLKYFLNNAYLFSVNFVIVYYHFLMDFFATLCYTFIRKYFENIITRIESAPTKVKTMVEEERQKLKMRGNYLGHRSAKVKYEKVLYSEYIEIIRRYQDFYRWVKVILEKLTFISMQGHSSLIIVLHFSYFSTSTSLCSVLSMFSSIHTIEVFCIGILLTYEFWVRWTYSYMLFNVRCVLISSNLENKTKTETTENLNSYWIGFH